jgi:hypothetical protein
MSDLDAVETCRDEGLESIAPSAIPGMSPDGNGARLVRDRDRVLHRKSVLRDKRASLRAKIPSECISKIRDEAACDHSPRDVRPPDRSAVGLKQYFVHGQGNAELVESLDNPPSARVPGHPEIGQLLFERPELGKVQREEMNLVVLIVRTQLHAGYHANSGARGSIARRKNPIDRIVIGERNGRQTTALRLLYYALGWECSVRGG